MLPQFPKARKAQAEFMLELVMKSRNETAPMLASMPHRMQREGANYSFKNSQGDTEALEYEKLSVEIEIPENQNGKGLGILEFKAKAKEIGQQFAQEMSRRLQSELDRVTEKTGNVVRLDGKPIQPQHMFDLVEKAQVDFDENGKPMSGWIFLNPTAYQQAKEEIANWENDPMVQSKAREQMQRKLEEFHAREARRRLVD